MLKKISLIALFLISSIVFYGCSQNIDLSDENEPGGNNSIVLANETTPERIIIYTVDISFDVNDLDEASTTLKTLVETDEWFDSESLTTNYHRYTIRVKSSRLDTFIESLKDEYALRTYQKEGTDISIEYQDTSNQILSLEAQLDRLLVLYEEASLTDMIVINEQISDIEVELQSLQGTINQFDSLVEYSEVNLDFYGSTVITKSPFLNRVANGFLDGFHGLINFFDGFVIVIATIFPFLIVFGGAGIGFYVLFEKKRRKRVAFKEKKESHKKED